MEKSLIKVQRNESNSNNNAQTNNKLSRFYNTKNDLILPRAAEHYFNWRCLGYSDSTLDTKLRELGYLLSQGFDLKQALAEYKSDQDKYTKSAIRQSYVYYIMYIRYLNYYRSFSDILIKLPENNLFRLLVDELNLVYSPLKDEVKCMFWSDNEVLEAAEEIDGKLSEQDKLFSAVASSKMLKTKLLNKDKQ